MNRGHQAEDDKGILDENFDITETSTQTVDRKLKDKTCHRHRISNCLEIIKLNENVNFEYFQNLHSTVDVRADLV